MVNFGYSSVSESSMVFYGSPFVHIIGYSRALHLPRSWPAETRNTAAESIVAFGTNQYPLAFSGNADKTQRDNHASYTWFSNGASLRVASNSWVDLHLPWSSHRKSKNIFVFLASSIPVHPNTTAFSTFGKKSRKIAYLGPKNSQAQHPFLVRSHRISNKYLDIQCFKLCRSISSPLVPTFFLGLAPLRSKLSVAIPRLLLPRNTEWLRKPVTGLNSRPLTCCAASG